MKFITGRCDEETQPWARQSLVQLAPVLGRITDPQTVQTTTSDQSEQSVQQSSTGMQQPVHANHRNTYHLTLNVITSMLNAQQTCLLVYSYTAVVIILTMWDILLHKKKPQAYYTTKQKLQKKKKKPTCASTYHRFCWNCRPQCLQHVCTWSDPRHTFYCRESSWVCKQTTIWTFKITPLSVKKHTKNISLKLSIVLFILSVYVLHQFKTK